MSDWLDLQLSHHLAPVEAPEALWNRIQSGTVLRPACPRAPRSVTAAVWPIAAILTLMAAAGTLWLVAKGEEPALDLRQLAIVLLRSSEPVELHSSDPEQISAWMRRAGLNVTLPSQRGTSVRLVGARVIERHGARIGEIQYKVGPDSATLLVARAGTGPDGGHGRLAWTTQGQSYAVASSSEERPDAPCLLCHASL
jgi:anti-sigma factor RsiW